MKQHNSALNWQRGSNLVIVNFFTKMSDDKINRNIVIWNKKAAI